MNPKDRSIFVPCSSLLPPELLSLLSSLLILRLEVPRLYLLPSNPLPLYSTGLFSGVVLDCGFLKTLISVIYDGFMVGGGKVAEDCGGRRISQIFREGLAHDNAEKKRNWNGEYELIENIKVNFKLKIFWSKIFFSLSLDSSRLGTNGSNSPDQRKELKR